MKSKVSYLQGLFHLLWGVLPIYLGAGFAWSQQLIDTYDDLTTKRIAASAAVENGYFKDALAREQTALQMAETRFGKLHPKTVEVLDDLATLYWITGRYQEAEETYKWGLAVREKALGPDDPQVADSLSHLAALYTDLGLDSEAEGLEEKALQIIKKGGDEITPDCVPELLLLGNTQLNLKKYAEAEKALQQGLVAEQNSPKPDPGLVLDYLAALAQADQAVGHAAQAEARLEEYQKFCGKFYKTDSVEMADAWENLGDFYHSQGRKDKSKECYESALKIYGPFVDTGATYASVPNLLKASDSYQANGDHATAQKLREKALGLLKDALGANHPRVALCLASLAEDDLALGDKTNALKKLGESLEILKTSLGGEHTLTLSVQKRLHQLNAGN